MTFEAEKQEQFVKGEKMLHSNNQEQVMGVVAVAMDMNSFVRQEMVRLGVVIGGSHDPGCTYDPEGNKLAKPQTPVIGLSADRWFVLDVDSAEGLGLFHRRLTQKKMDGLAAYVLTDKGVLLVYEKKDANRADIDADVRYERLARDRRGYAMHCLSKETKKPRTMMVYSSIPDGCARKMGDADSLAMVWNQLARQAAELGIWADSLKPFEFPKVAF